MSSYEMALIIASLIVIHVGFAIALILSFPRERSNRRRGRK